MAGPAKRLRSIQVEERHLQPVGADIGKNFQSVGRCLGLKTNNFDNLEHSNPRASLPELGIRMLNIWREQTPAESRTVDVLLDALRRAKREDLAELLEAGIAKEVEDQEEYPVHGEEPSDENNMEGSPGLSKASTLPDGCQSITEMKDSSVTVHHGKMNISPELEFRAFNEDRENRRPLNEIRSHEDPYDEVEVYVIVVGEVKPMHKRTNKRRKTSKGTNLVETFPVRNLRVKEEKASTSAEWMSLTGKNTKVELKEGMKIRFKVSWSEEWDQFEAVESFPVQVLPE